MTPNQHPHVTLQHPGELLASVPHLLGFRPADSLVAIGLNGSAAASVNVVLRSDLPPPSEARALAEYMLLPLTQHEATAIILVVVGGRVSADDLPHRELLARCESVLVDGGFSVLHQLWTPDIAAGRRWQCYDDFHCTGVLPDPAGTELAAVVNEAGMVTYDSREDIVATLAPDPDDVLARRSASLDRLTDTAEPGPTEPEPQAPTDESPVEPTEDAEPGDTTEPGRAEPDDAEPGDAPQDAEPCRSVPPDPADDQTRTKLDTVQAAIAAAVATPPTLVDEDVIRLAGALADHRVRDTCLDFDRLPDVAAAERLWTALAKATPAPERAEPACLLAFSAYARGDGALAGIALTQAETADPGHRLSNLLRSALTLGLAPGKIRVAGIRAATFARHALSKDQSSTAPTQNTATPTPAGDPADTHQEES
jgi:hypothetical protein